jgi:uncharacterized protein (TIGR03083 family)
MAGQWDASDFAAKHNLLKVIKREANSVFRLAEQDWEGPTRAGHWQVRDVMGHMVDVTEGYLMRFAKTRKGETPEAIGPLTEMGGLADDRALAYREIAQPDLLKRLREAFDEVMDLFDGLVEEDWTGLQVMHGYMGPLPAFMYPVFQVMDYGVHGWDIREGLRMPHTMANDTADLLVPFMFVLWQSTCDATRCEGEIDVGIRIAGGNSGGSWRVHVTSEGYNYEPGVVDDLPAVFEFDPGSFVLTAFGRVSGGTVTGDREMANRHNALFLRI